MRLLQSRPVARLSFTATLLLTAITLNGCGGAGAGTAVQSTIPTTAGANHNAPSVGFNAGTARTWQVAAGGERHEGELQALAMLPATITIDEGDSITWNIQGEPHTVTFLGSFSAPPGDPTQQHGGSTFNGSDFVSSGILGPGAHYTLTFTKAGTYSYMCVLHAPEMSGVVIVQPRGTPLPHPQGYYTGAGTSTLNGLLSQAMAAVKSIPYAPGGTTIAAGVSPGTPTGAPTQATVLRFLSGDRLNLTSETVKVGTTLTWVNLSNNEPHTVTFPVAGQPLPALPGDPFTPPMGGSTYDGTSITNSGPLFGGQQYSLTFTKAGTFTYYCLFHDDVGMIGTVIVTR